MRHKGFNHILKRKLSLSLFTSWAKKEVCWLKCWLKWLSRPLSNTRGLLVAVLLKKATEFHMVPVSKLCSFFSLSCPRYVFFYCFRTALTDLLFHYHSFLYMKVQDFLWQGRGSLNGQKLKGASFFFFTCAVSSSFPCPLPRAALAKRLRAHSPLPLHAHAPIVIRHSLTGLRCLKWAGRRCIQFLFFNCAVQSSSHACPQDCSSKGALPSLPTANTWTCSHRHGGGVGPRPSHQHQGPGGYDDDDDAPGLHPPPGMFLWFNTLSADMYTNV